MTVLKNRVSAFLAQQKEGVREEVARETNIFSVIGRMMLLGLDLARDEKRLLEALLKTDRHLETRIEESAALVDNLYAPIREAQLVRTIPGFGKYLAVLVAVEIADLARFADAAHRHAYAGVIPSAYSSGDRTHHGRSCGPEIAGCVGRPWRRSGQPAGWILTGFDFMNSWPTTRARTKPEWPPPGDS